MLASETCQFLRFESITNATNLGPPFDDGVSEGWMGIFRYQVTMEGGDESVVESGCTLYDGQFGRAPTGTLIASQICAVVAPCLAFLAVLVSIFDVLWCRFYGNFIAMTTLLLTAAAVQGGTFIIFAQPSFCYDADIDCGVGTATYFSAAAAFSFFLACILLCCSPRPEPLRSVDRDGEKDDDEQIDPEGPIIVPPQITASHLSPSGNPSDDKPDTPWLS